MVARQAVLITGAAGEIGHSLIEHFASENLFQIVALDLQKIPSSPSAPKDFVSIAGDITNKDLIGDIFEKYNIAQVFHLAGILSSGGEKNPARTHYVNVEGSMNIITAAKAYSQKSKARIKVIFPSTIAVYGIPSLDEKNRAGRITEDRYTLPVTMYGINKLYVENIGRYYATSYKLLDQDPNDIKIDFRAIRFPGLMSAETMPTGGTSDYASEMIHACAQNKPYTCFVSPSAKIPFMAMPDGIKALIELSQAPAEQLTQLTYNVGAFAVTAEEIRQQLSKTFPDAAAAVTYESNIPREGIVNTWPADVDDSKAANDWGWKPSYSFESAFEEYLIPNIRKKYQ